MIGALRAEQQQRIMVYGGGRAVAEYQAALPEAVVLGTDGARACLLRYGLLGWSGYLPGECRNTLFMLPTNIARWIWGYPNRLTDRLTAHGSRLVLLGPYDGSGYSSAVDTLAELDAVPRHFDGYVWTNRVDRIGPAIAAR